MDETESVEQLKKEKIGRMVGVKKEIRTLPDLLRETETAVNLAVGNYGGKTGLVAVTDQRVLFLQASMVGSQQEDFEFDRITSVESSKGMTSGNLKIHSAGNVAELKAIQPRERAQEIGEYVRSHLGRPAQQAAPTAAPDPADQLRKLGELRDAGVLTADEFEAKKAELLARL